MFDDFHCLLSSLATLVVRAHLLSQDLKQWMQKELVSHKHLHVEGPSECLQQDAKKPIRWNSAMSRHTRSSSGSSPFISSTLFSGATCAAHETRLHSGRSARWSIAGQPKMAHPANQLGMRCNVPVCKTCPGAGKRLRLQQRHRDYWLMQPNGLQFLDVVS